MTDPSPARVAAERGRSERRNADRWHPSSMQPAEPASPVPAPTPAGQRDTESREPAACSHREHEMRGLNAYGRYFDLVGDKAVPSWEFCLTETQAPDRTVTWHRETVMRHTSMTRPQCDKVLDALAAALERQIRESIAGEINARAAFWGMPGAMAIYDAARIARGSSS